jgi:type IV secretory pathway VirB9-like protein
MKPNRQGLHYGLIAVAVVVMCPSGCTSRISPPPIVKIAKKELYIPPDPYRGLSPDVRTAIESNETSTLRNGITTVFAYSPDLQWTIYCRPLRVTEIRLNQDEFTDKDDVVVGDSVRWGIRIGAQAVMVEPLGTAADPSMTTNLVIHTNRRSYHLLLRLRSHYMDAVAWYYPDEVRATAAQREAALKLAATQNAPAATADPPDQQESSNQ